MNHRKTAEPPRNLRGGGAESSGNDGEVLRRFIVPGRCGSLNDYLRERSILRRVGRGRRVSKYDERKAREQANVSLAIAAARVRRLEAEELPVEVWLVLREAALRRDEDDVASAAQKVIRDALVASKIIPGDGPRYVVGGRSRIERCGPSGPEIVVEIRRPEPW